MGYCLYPFLNNDGCIEAWLCRIDPPLLDAFITQIVLFNTAALTM